MRLLEDGIWPAVPCTVSDRYYYFVLGVQQYIDIAIFSAQYNTYVCYYPNPSISAQGICS